MFVHGTADTTVAIELDDRLVARARAVGVRTEDHRVWGPRAQRQSRPVIHASGCAGTTAVDRLLRFTGRALS